MSAILLTALLSAAPSVDGSTIAVSERPDRAIVLVITPRSTSPNIPSSTYLDASQRVFGRETSLSLASAEQAGIDANAMRECPVDQRLQCWSRLAGADDRYVARYLLVLNLQAVGGSDRATVLLLDLESVRRILEGGADAGDAEAQEQRIFELAVQLDPVVLSPAEDGAADRFMGDVVARDLREILEASGHFRPYGQIELTVNTPALVIELDGRVIGTTGEGPSTLKEVLPGERVLSLRRGDGWSSQGKVQVTKGQTARIELDDPPSETHPGRPVVWVSGLVVAAVGVAVLGITAASAADGLQSVCLQRGAGDSGCGAPGTITSGYAGIDATPSFEAGSVNPSGLLMAPLGLGLAAGGLATGLGTLLFGDEADFPWPQILVGLGTAGLVYSVGAVTDAR